MNCLRYGATLLGLMEEEYYRQICVLADWIGAEPRAAADESAMGSLPAHAQAERGAGIGSWPLPPE